MRLRTLLIGLALAASCMVLRGQELQVVERTGGVTAMVPSLQNLCQMLEMDGDKVAEVLSGYGYTELQATDGYRRFSNGTEQHPSYTQGLQLFFLGTVRREVRCVVSHDLAPALYHHPPHVLRSLAAQNI